MRKSKVAALFILLLTASAWAATEDQPTQKKKLTLQDLLGAPSKSSSPPPSVQGVRGLDETDAGLDTKARNVAAIDKLDAVVIHPDELQKFIEEGHLK
jgi:hypothetical protein